MEKAIVCSGCRKLICEIGEDLNISLPITNPVKLENCFEIRSDMIMIPTPNGLGLSYKTHIVPVDAEDGPVTIFAVIDNIRYFKDMNDKGMRYERMLAEFHDIMLKNRAERSGLSVEKEMPKEPKGSLII
jgi:hypothetical protein